MILELPTEIKTMIFERCTIQLPLGGPRDYKRMNSRSNCFSEKTWMALRLVNKLFEEIITPWLFNEVHVRLFPRSLESFRGLCHSGLAKHVKEIHFHPDLLPEWDEEDWYSTLHYNGKDMILEDIDSMYSGEHPELDVEWTAYRTILELQEPWRENTADCTKLLESRLSMLPNLRKTTVAWCYLGDRDRDSEFYRTSSGTRYIRSDHILQDSTESEDALALAYVEAIGLRSASARVKQVETLVFELTSYLSSQYLMGTSDSRRDVVTNHTLRWQNVIKTFAYLKELTLAIPGAVVHDVQTSADKKGHVKDTCEILRAAKNLEKLNLIYGDIDSTNSPDLVAMSDDLGRRCWMLPQFALMPFLSSPETTFPHLKDLRIKATVPGQEFSDFLRLHASTLRRLEICDSYSDNWDVVLYSIARYLILDRRYLDTLEYGYCVPVDDHSWMIRENTYELQRRHFIQRLLVAPEVNSRFTEAMERFFAGRGDLALPREYHDEERDLIAYQRSQQ